MRLKPGDRVRVKDKETIMKTLDSNRCFEGLLFSKEMEEFCGRDHTIRKQTKKVIDYYNKGIRKLKDSYILDGVHCLGTKDYPECDRMCFFFWKDRWIEKVG